MDLTGETRCVRGSFHDFNPKLILSSLATRIPALLMPSFAVSKHRSVSNLFELHPWTSPDAFVAPNATVIGDVSINLRSSVMYGAVVRGAYLCRVLRAILYCKMLC